MSPPLLPRRLPLPSPSLLVLKSERMSSEPKDFDRRGKLDSILMSSPPSARVRCRDVFFSCMRTGELAAKPLSIDAAGEGLLALLDGDFDVILSPNQVQLSNESETVILANLVSQLLSGLLCSHKFVSQLTIIQYLGTVYYTPRRKFPNVVTT